MFSQVFKTKTSISSSSNKTPLLQLFPFLSRKSLSLGACVRLPAVSHGQSAGGVAVLRALLILDVAAVAAPLGGTGEQILESPQAARSLRSVWKKAIEPFWGIVFFWGGRVL